MWRSCASSRSAKVGTPGDTADEPDELWRCYKDAFLQNINGCFFFFAHDLADQTGSCLTRVTRSRSVGSPRVVFRHSPDGINFIKISWAKTLKISWDELRNCHACLVPAISGTTAGWWQSTCQTAQMSVARWTSASRSSKIWSGWTWKTQRPLATPPCCTTTPSWATSISTTPRSLGI